MHRAYILIVLTLAYVCNYLDRQVMAIVMEPLKADLRLSDSVLGLLTGFGFAACYSILGIPLARLADTRRRIPIIAGALAVFSLFTAGCAAVANVWHLALCRIGVATGEAGTNPPSHSIIADLYSPGERPMAMAVFSTGVNWGIIIAFLGGGLLTSALGWRATFIAAAVPGLLLSILLLATVREPARSLPTPRRANDGPTLRDVLAFLGRQRAYVHLVVAIALSIFAGFSIMTWTPALFMRFHRLSAAQTGLALAALSGVGGLIGTLLGGFVSSRSARRDVRWSLWSISALLVVAAPCAVAAFMLPDISATLVLMSVPVLATTFFLPSALAQIQGLAPVAMRATASATAMLVGNLFGMGAGPTTVGIASDALASLGIANSLGLALSVAALAWAWAAVHFYFAGRHLARGLAAASAYDRENNPVENPSNGWGPAAPAARPYAHCSGDWT
jgi:predicted MFS family arabinose efflux permease